MFKTKYSTCWFLLIMCLTGTLFSQTRWNFLPSESIGAKTFLQKYPKFDGRGTVIFILDSGVDVGVAGLQKTTTGDVKILDVRDFSGQGDVELEIGTEKSDANERYIEHPDGFRLSGHHKLAQKPVDGEYLIGYLDESWFANSQVDDINNNYIIDEQFGILVFDVGDRQSSHYIAFLDTDADGHIDDENPIYDYAEKHQVIRLRGRNSAKYPNLLNFALKINAEQLLVSFHFDDSGHGTHVAGIAAGYQINYEPNFNGIAPGAQIISLKIGDNTLAGNATVSGSMRKAFIHAARWAIQHPQKRVVINLSYSLGAELPGQADIERFISALINEYPNLIICLSAGNLGPGISSIGTPGSCNAAISTGAMLDVDSARDLYGVKLEQDKLFFFSSRGGDIPKPDLIAPGVAASTVPPFEADDKKYGASMASPQVAGAAALLLSAFPNESRLQHLLIKQALISGAKPIPNYSFIEQGNGVPQVINSYNFLKNYLADSTRLGQVSYKISTVNPEFPDKSGTTAYWRTGGYFPKSSEDVQFQVNAVFPHNFSADMKARFFRGFELVSTAPWLTVNQKNTYLRGTNTTPITASYQEKYLDEPGLYTGKILAFRKGKKHIAENIEFELQNTVVVPFTFHCQNQYQKHLQPRISPGDCKRYFVLVPPGASAMQLEFAPISNKYCAAFPVIFDPAGRRISLLDKIDSKNKQPVTKIISEADLLPGIWEIDLYSPFTEKTNSILDFNIRFLGFQIMPNPVTQFDYPIGQPPTGKFTVTNYFNHPPKCTAQGIIAGWKKVRHVQVPRGHDLFEYRFRLTEETDKISFNIKLPRESFVKFTNVTVNVIDPSGIFVVKEGLSYSQKSISLDGKAPGIYTLEVRGARAYTHSSQSWELEITEYYYQKADARIRLDISQNKNSVFTLYPHMPNRLNFSFSGAPPVAPDGSSLFGLIMFLDHATHEIITTLKLDFDTSFK